MKMKVIAQDTDWRLDDSALANRFWDIKLLAQIGRDLRATYEDTLKEPVPRHLGALLARLEDGETNMVRQSGREQ